MQGLEESTTQQLDKGEGGRVVLINTPCLDSGCCHDVTPWHVLLVSEQDIMRTITNNKMTRDHRSINSIINKSSRILI